MFICVDLWLHLLLAFRIVAQFFNRQRAERPVAGFRLLVDPAEAFHDVGRHDAAARLLQPLDLIVDSFERILGRPVLHDRRRLFGSRRLKSMDFPITLRKREAMAADALQERLRLRDISLYRCEIDGAGPLLEATEPVRLLDSAIDSVVSRVGPDGLDFAVSLRIDCDEPAFHVHTTFLARYLLADCARPASKAEAEAFRKGQAVVTVWPYIREFVQTVTARMGFPTEPLPLVRLVTPSR